MARLKLLVGVAAIDAAIKEVAGVAENLNDRIDNILTSIIVHAAGPGNGDVSRALTLVKALRKYRSINTNYIVGFLRYFGSMTVNVNADGGKGKVSLMSRDAKGYRGFDVDGAKANKWYEAVNDDGERAPWYQGPVQAEYTPGTIGDVAGNIHNFVKRLAGQLDDTKTVKGKEVPLFELTQEQREQVDNALAFLDRVSATLARQESIAELEAAREKAIKEAGQDTEVLAVITPPKAEEKQEELREPAVA